MSIFFAMMLGLGQPVLPTFWVEENRIQQVVPSLHSASVVTTVPAYFRDVLVAFDCWITKNIKILHLGVDYQVSLASLKGGPLYIVENEPFTSQRPALNECGGLDRFRKGYFKKRKLRVIFDKFKYLTNTKINGRRLSDIAPLKLKTIAFYNADFVEGSVSKATTLHSVLANPSSRAFIRLDGAISRTFSFYGSGLGMLGSPPSPPSREGGCGKGEKSYERADDTKPEGSLGPVSAFLCSIRSLPLSAKIGITIVFTLLASGVWLRRLWQFFEGDRGALDVIATLFLACGLIALSGVAWW